MHDHTLTIEAARAAIDEKTKPLGALGQLEEIAVRLALLQNTLTPRADRARVCVFAGDHGVTDEGVSAYPRVVTREMMRNFERGGAAINVISASLGVDVRVYDVGVDSDDVAAESVRVCRGTRNIVDEPAMTADQVDAALEVGANAARDAAAAGIQVLGLGEMGIGNTTIAAAVLSALSGQPATGTVGLGTGIDAAALERKRAVVECALAVHGDALGDGREVLRRLGGLELAAIAGAAREAARLGLAVVADGFISTVSVLAALHIASREGEDRARELTRALFFAHRSAERGHALALAACAAFAGCDATPLLDLGLRLGEGSGAALAAPVLRAAAAVMRDMATFASASVSTAEQSPAAQPA